MYTGWSTGWAGHRWTTLDDSTQYQEVRSSNRTWNIPYRYYELSTLALMANRPSISFNERVSNKKKAMSRRDKAALETAMKEEIVAIEKISLWYFWNILTGTRKLATMRVFHIKHKSNGSVDLYQARLVVKQFLQRNQSDFGDIYSSVIK